ncbi:MAG TPA: S8 family serine peptidase [Candidatus Angelobacter sp.]|nr:S8 family serine peptidase [Candidatus Angelobacter sp.]
MKQRCILSFLLLVFITGQAMAQNRVIVRDTLGQNALNSVCLLLHCTVREGLDDGEGSLFLVTSNGGTLQSLLENLTSQLGVVSAEPDQVLKVKQTSAPSGLFDTTPVTYYGTSVWDGYANQPAVSIVNLPSTQSTYNVTGSGIVAIIDTGVDPTHPVLQGVLLDGWDFTRNQAVGSELVDTNQSTMAVVNGASPVLVNQSTMAVVNSTGSSVFTQSQFAAFGHGTMTAGIVHLVAPTAQIMPLKAFHSDGTANLCDVIRAVYYAIHHSANVLSMSFDFTSSSPEMAQAINTAASNNIITVASAGNDGQAVVVYPAGLSNVMGVASTTNSDTLSTFSNYGQPPVWVGAPGEGIISPYPYGTYAAGWGTSFSAPFVAGTAALLRSMDASVNQSSASAAISNAFYISPDVGYGRLDIYQAVTSWCVTTHHC